MLFDTIEREGPGDKPEVRGPGPSSPDPDTNNETHELNNRGSLYPNDDVDPTPERPTANDPEPTALPLEGRPASESFASTNAPAEPQLATPFPDYQHLEIRTLPLSSIRTFDQEPRKRFDEEPIQSLAESIRDRGQLVPLLVTPYQGNYVLLGGNRRLRALKLLGATEARASIATEGFNPHTFNEDQAFRLSLIDNLHRKDLNPIEETAGIVRHLQRRLNLNSFEEVSAVIRQAGSSAAANPLAVQAASILREFGKEPRSFRNNRLQLLSLQAPLFDLVLEGRLHYTKALLLNRVEPESKRQELTEHVITANLSRAEIERLIREGAQPASMPEPPQQARLDRSMAQLHKAYEARKDNLSPDQVTEIEKRISELRRLLKRKN